MVHERMKYGKLHDQVKEDRIIKLPITLKYKDRK